MGFLFRVVFSRQQRMNISCSSGTNFYQGNYMAATIDATSVSSNRSSAFAFRSWWRRIERILNKLSEGMQ
jgi:hypothetical protein